MAAIPSVRRCRTSPSAPNGVAVFYYQYLENGLNLPMFDLNKPLGYDQFLRAFNSGGAGGGTSVATDGESVWAFSTDGGPKYVYRADGKSFGVSHGANRANGYLPDRLGHGDGRVARCENGAVVCVCRATGKDRGILRRPRAPPLPRKHDGFREQLTVHDGANGKIVAEVPLSGVLGLAVHDDVLYALQADGGRFFVTSAPIVNGVPSSWQRVFTVPTKITPADLEVDSHSRFYLSDSAANKVFQLDAKAKVTRTFGRLAAQKSGSYDPQTFMAPAKLATWKNASGEDRLIVVEQAGPNRASEWSADGKLVREFMSLQTHANDGYGFDPEHPQQVYLPGKQGWMTRFKVNYETREWSVDAVWPFDETDLRAGRLDRLQFVRTNGASISRGGAPSRSIASTATSCCSPRAFCACDPTRRNLQPSRSGTMRMAMAAWTTTNSRPPNCPALSYLPRAKLAGRPFTAGASARRDRTCGASRPAALIRTAIRFSRNGRRCSPILFSSRGRGQSGRAAWRQ